MCLFPAPYILLPLLDASGTTGA